MPRRIAIIQGHPDPAGDHLLKWPHDGSLTRRRGEDMGSKSVRIYIQLT
jgi:hypothetical protein